MKVGVALENIPKLLQDLVLDILEQQADIAVVTVDATGREQFMAAVATHDLDVLILSDGSKASLAQPSELLRIHPRLKLLALSPDGRSAKLYAGQSCLSLDNLSPKDLIGTIRGADG